jgi:hypothetical protein
LNTTNTESFLCKHALTERSGTQRALCECISVSCSVSTHMQQAQYDCKCHHKPCVRHVSQYVYSPLAMLAYVMHYYYSICCIQAIISLVFAEYFLAINEGRGLVSSLTIDVLHVACNVILLSAVQSPALLLSSTDCLYCCSCCST